MNCEELNGLLDRMMDGELSEDQRREMEAHGAGCPECAAAIRSAEQLKALLDEMEPEVEVPLAAQAAWRGVIRAESKQRGRKRLVRWIGSAAAAVVVLVGVGLALNLHGAPQRQTNAALTVADEAPVEAAMETSYEAEDAPALMSNAAGARAMDDFAVADGAVVETDGAVEMEAAEEEGDALYVSETATSSAALVRRAPACELSLRVEDVDTACARIRDLVEEYEGSADVQSLEEGGANVYVEIGAENAGDFINAVAPLDVSGQKHDVPDFSDEGTVLVLLALKD